MMQSFARCAQHLAHNAGLEYALQLRLGLRLHNNLTMGAREPSDLASACTRLAVVAVRRRA
eukprot:280328-Lingulodinium_polyedra.AAC.1